MPFVDLHTKDDYASIFYTTNSTFNNVGAFDPDRPTIAILHPAFLDATWLHLQLGETALDRNYNLIAFDMRSSGRSTCRPSGHHDSWVDAADLALCFHQLHLPPAHILALEGSSIYCALRFALLFPESCLSLTLVNVPAPVELRWIYKNIDELVHATAFADDPESFGKAAFEFIEFLFGPRTEPDLVDDLITFWKSSHPPSKRARTAETTSVYINRASLSPEVYGMITQPVLVIQGEKNELCPLKYAERLVSQLTGVEGGAILYTLKGGTSMSSVVPDQATAVNSAFLDFLLQLPHHRSDIVPPEIPLRDRMYMALDKLAEITGDDDFDGLDPQCPLSFSSVTPEVLKAQTELLRHYMKGAGKAYTPVSPEEWELKNSGNMYDRDSQSPTEEGRFSTSTSSTLVSGPERGKLDSERNHKSSARSDSDSMHIKSGFTSHSLEKHNLKIGANLQAPLQRLMT